MRDLSRIVLASVSPRRFELLTSLGLDVDVRPSQVVEGAVPGHGPLELAVHHANAKADAVARRGAEDLVVGADTVVDLDGRALGKPSDREEARRMIRALAGREHIVHTAYAAIDGVTGQRLEGVESTRVRFARLSSEAIERYVASGDGDDKAGAYGIQGRGAALVERIEGDFYTVMGFPLGHFVRALSALGYRLPERAGALR